MSGLTFTAILTFNFTRECRVPQLCHAIVSMIPLSLPSDLTDQVAGAAEMSGVEILHPHHAHNCCCVWSFSADYCNDNKTVVIFSGE